MRWVLVLAFAAVAVARGEAPRRFTIERATFRVSVGEIAISDRVGSAFVLPRLRLPIAVFGSSRSQRFHASATGGTLVRARGDEWSWTAPSAPGLYPLTVVEEQSGETLRINVFVMVPAARMRRGALNGYPIGRYPRSATRFDPFYRAPDGFIEVTRNNEDTELSPHFRLKQFVCKQESRYPKYLVLRSELVAKLERLLEAVNERGIQATTFQVMSGYRTPRYNHVLGNVRNSAHLFGGAADVFVDEDGDGVMDDLNGDGVSDYRDALVLSELVEQLDATDDEEHQIGGLGRYHANRRHGPFVHVDVRGYAARWGG